MDECDVSLECRVVEEDKGDPCGQPLEHLVQGRNFFLLFFFCGGWTCASVWERQLAHMFSNAAGIPILKSIRLFGV